MLELRARPKAHVAYLREAWVRPDDHSIRLTMDREVLCARQMEARLGTSLFEPVRPFGNEVILELKFTGRFPNWFRDLVEVFSLTRTCAAKYADGVELLGDESFSGAGAGRWPHRGGTERRRAAEQASGELQRT